MNLKKIEMYGFKSFADRISIDFTENITAIVGPNGCGKSNVADAIRWVFGVQAPSAIRCSQMTDVIFAGTTMRRPLSYAEVSVFLDNVDKKYPISFEELIITRKIYRSGESEYLINNNVCLLKDIVELFRDTGIGKEGYSIVAQGMVQNIVTSKSKDRRKIFEEAAGIAKFRARKEDTEKKLVKTRDNILRLNDIKESVESRLVPLEKQAKDAIKSKELKEELRNLEVNNYLYQSDNNAKIKGVIEESLHKTCEKIEKLEQESAALQKDYSLKMVDRENTDIYATRLHNEKSDLMVEQAKKAGDNRVYGEKIANLAQEIQRQNDAYLTANARIDDRNKQLSVAEATKDKKNTAFIENSLKYEKLNKEFFVLQDVVLQKEREVDKSTEYIMRSADELTGIKTDAVKLVAMRDMLLDTVGIDKDALFKKKQRFSTSEKRTEQLMLFQNELTEDENRRKEELQKAEINISACRKELNESTERKVQANNRLTELEVKIKMTEDYKNALQGYQAAVRFLMNATKSDRDIASRIVGVVGEMLTVPRDLSLAIEVALGGNVNNIVVNTPEDASNLIEYLYQNRAGRATFLPLSSLRPSFFENDRILDEDGVLGLCDELIKFDKKIAPAIAHLLGRVVVVDSRPNAIRIAKKYNNSVRMVTLDGSLFSVGGAITGGQELKSDSRVLSRENEIEELKKKMNSVSKEYEMLKNDILDKEAELEDLTRAGKVIQAQIDKINVAMATNIAQIDASKQEEHDAQEEIDRLIGQNSEASEKIKFLEKQIAAVNANEGSATSKREEADDYLGALREELRTLKDTRDNAQREVNQCLMAVNTLKGELDGLDAETSRLKTELNMLHNNLIDANSQKKTAEKALEDAQNKIDTTVFSAEEQTRLEEIKQKLQEIDDYKKKLVDEIQQNNDKRAEIQTELTGLSERRTKDEMKLERIDSDVETQAIRIRDEYNMGYDEAVLFRTDDFNPDTATSEIGKLKRKIENIGPVNELAVEQFEENKNQFEEITVQYNDLTAAEQDLLKVICDLTKDMENTFASKFKQIADNFEVIFKELFCGGNGKLELDTSEGGGVLEADINIKAAPPGKNLKHMSLLSGGEQTLTAIAILFSIIRLTPLPFCVLDEVEAALDDANAQLFAKYLKRFPTTQFILITHKKPTMGIAGTLHGITTNKEGISIRLDVQMKDAHKFATET